MDNAFAVIHYSYCSYLPPPKNVAHLIIAITIVAGAYGAEPDLRKLDPREPKDRAMLLEIVKRSPNNKSNQAANILTKAGHGEELLRILWTTTSYNTMKA